MKFYDKLTEHDISFVSLLQRARRLVFNIT